MNKQFLIMTSVAALLSGCVSGGDFAKVQSQVSQLQGKVNRLEGQLARSNQELVATKGELAVVKEQRVVRLPTGAPLEMRARNDATVTTGSVSNNETDAFEQAVQQYKSGDLQGAMSSLERFIATNPSSQNRNEALFYLGQAAYTSRDYNRAQQALEPLVLQPTNGQINQPAADLLRSVYQAQGNKADLTKLDDYLRSFSQPTAQPMATQPPPTAPIVETPAAVTPAPVSTPIINSASPVVTPAAAPETTAAEQVQRQVESIVEKTEPKPVRPIFVTQ